MKGTDGAPLDALGRYVCASSDYLTRGWGIGADSEHLHFPYHTPGGLQTDMVRTRGYGSDGEPTRSFDWSSGSLAALLLYGVHRAVPAVRQDPRTVVVLCEGESSVLAGMSAQDEGLLRSVGLPAGMVFVGSPGDCWPPSGPWSEALAGAVRQVVLWPDTTADGSLDRGAIRWVRTTEAWAVRSGIRSHRYLTYGRDPRDAVRALRHQRRGRPQLSGGWPGLLRQIGGSGAFPLSDGGKAGVVELDSGEAGTHQGTHPRIEPAVVGRGRPTLKA